MILKKDRGDGYVSLRSFLLDFLFPHFSRYGGYPFRELRHKFLMAQGSGAAELTAACLPEGFEMIGLPGQTVEDLVQDIRTFQTIDADMIGMGPYLLSKGADMVDCGMMAHDPLLRLSLNMIAATRLVLRDVNIAAATALETLEPNGRILGIMSGCNVVMPNITPQATRSSYQLYDNKSGTEVGAESNTKIESDIVRIAGRRLGLNQLGSSIHWQSRR